MSDTAELAALVGVAPDVLVRALGDAWTEVAGPPHERWFVSGEPAQVAVGWDGFGFTLARPEPRWSGPAQLVWEFEPDRRFSSDDADAGVVWDTNRTASPDPDTRPPGRTEIRSRSGADSSRPSYARSDTNAVSAGCIR